MITVRSGSDRGEPEPYWSLRELVERGERRFEGTASEAASRLWSLLEDAVSSRMVADVPLGAFLSGGIDSSSIVAVMQSQSTEPIRTFTIGSHDRRYDEAPYARAIARHLGTDHTELYVSADDTMAVIPKLPALLAPVGFLSSIST